KILSEERSDQTADFATPQYGSDLSPIAAEYGSISACSTQNKAKRANKIVFLLLIRDQEAVGSNPIAPTISSQTWELPGRGDVPSFRSSAGLKGGVGRDAYGFKNGGHFGFSDADKALHYSCVELRAAGFMETANGFLQRQALAIWARGNHGVESIDHRD